jgi:cyanophycinase
MHVMRRLLALAGAIAWWLAASLGSMPSVSAASREGHLVLAGGGATPAVVFTRTLELSGGRRAIVAVFPQTYPNDSIGDAAVTLWKEMGAREVFKVSLAEPVAARAALDRATLIWIPGGFQGLFMKTIAGTPVPDQIRKRFAEGATIGGASAGAAAMSRTMIADESTPDGADAIGPGTDAGLSLWPEAMVSPHFSERFRLNPLLALLRLHPDLLGVGIDEGTAVIVSGGELEVLGRGSVTIVQPRTAAVRTLKSGTRFRFAPAHRGAL